MSTENLKKVRACREGLARYKKLYGDSKPTISEIIMDTPEEDYKFACAFSGKLTSVFNYRTITKEAAAKLDLDTWASLVAGKPHLFGYSPKDKFRGWHFVRILSKQPNLIEKMKAKGVEVKLTDKMLAKLKKLQPGIKI